MYNSDLELDLILKLLDLDQVSSYAQVKWYKSISEQGLDYLTYKAIIDS